MFAFHSAKTFEPKIDSMNIVEPPSEKLMQGISLGNHISIGVVVFAVAGRIEWQCENAPAPLFTNLFIGVPNTNAPPSQSEGQS